MPAHAGIIAVHPAPPSACAASSAPYSASVGREAASSSNSSRLRPGPHPVDDEKAAARIEHEQGMMPDVARVIHALPAVGAKGAVGGRVARIGADHDEPGPVLHRREQLAAERMALHQRDDDRLWPRLRFEQADVDRSAAGGHVDRREPIPALRKPLVDPDRRTSAVSTTSPNGANAALVSGSIAMRTLICAPASSRASCARRASSP